MALNLTLRKIYLYLFATVGLILVITGSVSLINLGLKVFIFKNADNYPVYIEKRIPTSNGEDRELTEEERAQRMAEEEDRQKKQQRSERERQAASAVAQLIVGIPLFGYHWSRILKENQV